MKEKAENQASQPSWRIIVALGTMGMYGDIDRSRLDMLPLAASLDDSIRGHETVAVGEGAQGGYFADWSLQREESADAGLSAVSGTVAALRSLGMPGVIINGVRLSDDPGLFWDSPDDVWPAMEDVTDLADAYQAVLSDITAEDSL